MEVLVHHAEPEPVRELVLGNVLPALAAMVLVGLDEAAAQGIPYEEALLLLAKSEIDMRAGAAPDVVEMDRAQEILSGLGVLTPPRPPT